MAQLVKIADAAALDDLTAESLIRNTTTATNAAVRDHAADAAIATLAEQPSVEQAAVDAMSNAAVQAKLAWRKTSLPLNQDESLLTDGVHQVLSGSAAASIVGPPQLPAAARYPGLLERVTTGSSQRFLRYTPTSAPAADGIQTWQTVFNGTAWSQWSLVSGGIYPRDSVYATLDAMPEGAHKVQSTTTVNRLGLPVNASGTLTITDPHPTYRVARFETIALETWEAVRASGVWGLWGLAGGGASGEASPSGWKAVALAVTAAQSTDAAPLSGTWRVPLHWNVPIRRFRVRITLKNARYNGLVQGGGVTLDGVWVGDHAGAGAFTAAPKQIAGSAVVPDSGDAWVSAWIDAPIGDNIERLLSFSYTATTAPNYGVAFGYEFAGKVGADVAPAGGVAKTDVPFDIHVEAEIPSAVPILATFGDSKSCGVGAARSLLDSTLSQWCRANGVAPMHFSSSGDSLQNYAVGTWKIDRWSGVVARPDFILIELGINDLLTRTAAQMATDRATLVGKIQQHVGSDIGVVTIAPNEAHTAGQLAERQAYNSAIRSALPAGLNRLFDFDQVIALDASTIKPEYDADGLHLNAAGYAAEGGTFRHIVAPARV